MKSPLFSPLLRPSHLSLASLGALVFTLTLGGTREAAAQIAKEDNPDNLNLATSWVGEVVPTGDDIAQWGAQVTGANTADLGANLNWKGISILNPGGNVGITGSFVDPEIPENPPIIYSLTLGGSGIDMSASTRNLTISSPLVLGSAQTWSVASGRTLTVASTGSGAVSGTGPLTIRGPGTTRLGGTGATYTWTGGMNLGGGNGQLSVAATGSDANSANTNLFINLAAVSASSALTLNLPALTTNGAAVHALAGSGSGTTAYIPTFASLKVASGNTVFTAQRGTGSRVIYTFNSTTTRSVGGTVQFRDDINSSGNSSSNTGGYRMNNAAVVNGIVPYATYTTTSTNTSFFVASSSGNGLSNNGTAYNAFTTSTVSTLGTATQNSTVSHDVLLSSTPAVVNSIRFNDPNPRTVTIDTGNTLTIGAGAILVTNNGTANQTITGGTLMGGNPGSGSGYDLIIHQHNNTSTFSINSAIADHTVTIPVPEEPEEPGQVIVTTTALTKSGAGRMIIGGQGTYTGPTFVNAGTLLVHGALTGTPAVDVSRAATLGGTGSITGAVAVAGTLAPGDAIGTLSTGNLAFAAASTLAVQIDTSTSSADKVVVTGGVSTGGARVNLVLTDLGGDVVLPGGTKFILVDYSDTWASSDLLTYEGTLVANQSVITLGANSFTVDYSDVAAGGTALTLTSIGPDKTPFEAWADGFAVQLPLASDRLPSADPDGDGMNNLMEFALNGNPADGTDKGKMVTSTEDSNDEGTERDLSITLAVRNGAVLAAGPNGGVTLTVDGIVYTIQGSEDLAVWEKAIAEVTPASLLNPAPSAGWTARTFQVSDSNGLPDKRFIRLGVSQ
jgi:autotransporter-associated beta strand protein